MNQKLG